MNKNRETFTILYLPFACDHARVILTKDGTDECADCETPMAYVWDVDKGYKYITLEAYQSSFD